MMPEGRNELERFTTKFGYKKIRAALEAEIGDHSRIFSVETFRQITIHGIYLKFCHNLRIDGTCFEYDAVYEVSIWYRDKHQAAHQKSEWFIVHCAAEVDDSLKSFDVTGICVYKKETLHGNATENFVPIISKAQMDAEARAFLSRNYPPALAEPTPVPIQKIASSLGLDIQTSYMLSEDFSFFGEISFSDTNTKVFDAESGAVQNIDVARGTILIDSAIVREHQASCENFTIAHEVVHWEKHKLFADIKRLIYGKAYTAHRCAKPHSISWDSDERWTDEEWLEWHANGIGARIIMPKETIPAKIAEVSAACPEDIKSDKAEYYITIISELARFYGVSRQTARRRLHDIGYTEVEDIRLHDYDYNAFTHEIDDRKAYHELCLNAHLRILTVTGLFIRADNHFVINHKKCVEFDDCGIPHLTAFSRANLDICTLKFVNVRVNSKAGEYGHILHRDVTYETFQKFRLDDSKEALAHAHELAAKFPAEAADRSLISKTFSEEAQRIMLAKGVDSAIFQTLTLLSRVTFSRLKNTNYKPSFETAVAFCAGLNLDITVTSYLLRKAGYAFGESRAHIAYMTVITELHNTSIYVRNEYLRSVGIKPLGEKDAE